MSETPKYLPRTKIEMILQIVNWEHRYKFEHLESGAWCIERIRHLSKYSLEHLKDVYDFTFGVRPK